MKTVIFKISDSESEKISVLKENPEIKRQFSHKVTNADIIRLALNQLITGYNCNKKG